MKTAKEPNRTLEHIPGACGADEAGRGPLAGPVVAAAVILPEGFDIAGLDDSKKLDPPTRERLAERILLGAIFAIEVSEPDEIDRLNILHASEAAMSRAIARLPATMVYVDGHRLPPGLTCPAEAVIKGDGRFACIAAASILAKTTRDRLMTEMAARYPGYGFERHFGYPTPEHFEALRNLGPCAIHRRSFAPVREADQRCLIFEA
ncbi:ribonuclease HII [Fimbriimonas ginsengisoli]|uniref:Ribonuclease HII n=1 Tax=Fimbriimonas ginsengisoli Gsoil 348 TaxID=661478 RepID=A0A068NNF9_FIMGI|nr:ribonuclease HII [Fimbriimonas ginsengisoli]AIE85078.1 RNase HII [Fimbriimonas ginsengisoli Gsoil 348]